LRCHLDPALRDQYDNPRSFSTSCQGNSQPEATLAELVRILSASPHNRSGRLNIKKQLCVKPGEGQWRIRWRRYRLRYDIFGRDVDLDSFRDRKEAY
jgi:hypothetical protein